MSIGGMQPKVQEKRNEHSAMVPHESPDPPLHFHSANRSPISPQSHYSTRTSSQWARSSFKIGKSKPSKVRYMSKQEIIGVILSSILSFLIALAIVGFFYYGTPFAIRNLDTFMRSFTETYNDMTKEYEKTSPQKDKIPHPQPGKIQNSYQQQQSFGSIQPHLHLDDESFNSLYLAQKPFLFGSKDFKNHSQHDLEQLLTDILDVPLQISSLHDYSLYSDKATQSPLSFTVREYLSPFDYSLNPSLSTQFYYATDRNIANSITKLPDLHDLLLKEYPFLKDKLTTTEKDNSNNNNTVVLSVGHSHPFLSGLPFHLHTNFDRMNLLLSGEKKWILFSSDEEDAFPKDGFNPLRNLEDWLNSTGRSSSTTVISGHSSKAAAASATKITVPLFQVIQKAGEVLYIPQGWYHGTQTISPTSVSLSFEMTADNNSPAQPSGSDGTNKPQKKKNHVLHYLEEGKQRQSDNDYKGAIRMYKMGLAFQRKNPLLLEQLAEVYVLSEMFLAAEDLYHEIIEINPRNPIVYGKLIHLLIEHANKDVSESIANLLKQAEEKGIREEVLKLANDQL
jgi:oxalate decarboxylase/phosphoglucose isomerase-like protein (cupin superfamily)